MPARRRRFRSRPKPQVRRPPANAEIRSAEVRLIGADGSQRGVVKTSDALREAQEGNMDLVIVAEKANPPVARIQDLGKFMYERQKKQSKQKAKSKASEIKGIRIGFKIGAHDWELRLNQAMNFLAQGHKVKLEMRLRGREKFRSDFAHNKMKEFVALLPGVRTESAISRAGNTLSVILTK